MPDTNNFDVLVPSSHSWHLSEDGGIRSDANLCRRKSHSDHVEMGGRAVNAIIKWTLDDGAMSLARVVRWPTARLAQDDTYGSFEFTFDTPDDPICKVGGKTYSASNAADISINGFLSWEEQAFGMTVRRTIFPSVSLPCLIEKWEISNTSTQPRLILFAHSPIELHQPRELFKFTSYILRKEWSGGGSHTLNPGECTTAGMVFPAGKRMPLRHTPQSKRNGRPALLIEIRCIQTSCSKHPTMPSINYSNSPNCVPRKMWSKHAAV